MTDEINTLEKQFLTHIDEIDAEIEKLKQERAKAVRMLTRVRQNPEGMRDINRRNSLERVIIENRIISSIKSSKSSLSVKDIFREVLMISSSIKESTFRSYIHRLSKKGHIVQSGSRGYWKIGDDKG